MKDGFIRVGAASPKIKIANPEYNVRECIKLAEHAAEEGVKVLVFPELVITGATAGDLFYQSRLIKAAEAALESYIEETEQLDLISFIGMPISSGGSLYDCAVAVCRGELLGIVPKSSVSYGPGFTEARYFDVPDDFNTEIVFAGQETLFGTNILFTSDSMSDLVIACEIGEDITALYPPSQRHVSAGATLTVNLAAIPESVGKSERTAAAVKAHTERTLAAYVLSNAGDGESGTDCQYGGSSFIAECGKIIKASEPLSNDTLVFSEVDLEKCVQLRRIDGGFGYDSAGYDCVYFDIDESETELSFIPEKFPYFDNFDENRDEICDKVLEICAKALAARLERAYSECAVLGVSGGLDSTMAQLVSVRAMDILGRDRKKVISVTMPCFGTTKRTKGNAEKLSEALGVTFRTVDIKAAVKQHFRDIGHDEDNYNVVYENAQARERTQVLMDIANAEGGLVVGTGDLSELALGFATYNGDHMSMYAVNASVPKTLMRHIIKRCAERYEENGECDVARVLLDILATPVSPELLPADNGSITQCTEQIVGPYALHDFFIYNMLTYGFSPRKLLRLARAAFVGEYDDSAIKATLKVFIKRFFSQQFKRSCLPDGPRVSGVSLSPRGGFMMPSDAVCDAWLGELE